MKVLIIDDSRTVRMFVKMTLAEVGYDVAPLEDLFDYDPETKPVPDLVLVDVNMEEFLGTDLVGHIRQNWPGTTQICLYSDLPEEELERRAECCGADGYISKSWGYDGLVNQVRELIGSPESSSQVLNER